MSGFDSARHCEPRAGRDTFVLNRNNAWRHCEEIFRIKDARHAAYWQQQAYPVIRTSDGVIRWMDVSAYLKRESEGGKKPVRQVVFEGEPFTALSLLRWREKVLGPPAVRGDSAPDVSRG